MEMFLIQFCFPMSPDDDFWTNLTEMTQLRANQRREARPNSYYAKHMPADKSLTIAEMKAFIGCRLYMEYSYQRRAYSAPFFLSLDEGMIPAKNRLAIKQYIPSKPIKWGHQGFFDM